VSIALVDTSVWIDHLRGGDVSDELDRLLDRGFVFLHPWSLYELGLGGVAPEQWALLAALPAPDVPDDAAVWTFVQRHGLARRGLGWVDAALIASAHGSGMALWTLDEALAAGARRVRLPKLRIPR
jgi:predicted nucleic acid-binding protein